jgi:hypothetical protein
MKTASFALLLFQIDDDDQTIFNDGAIVHSNEDYEWAARPTLSSTRYSPARLRAFAFFTHVYFQCRMSGLM